MTQRLAEIADLDRLGQVPAAAVTSVSSGDKNAALDAASEWLQGQLGGRFKAPWQSWQDDAREVVCFRALSSIMGKRGFALTAGADTLIIRNRDEAERWAISVARGEVTPAIVGAAEQSPSYDAPRILSQPLQGWQGRAIR
jgi:phage gp36-like protein